MCKSFYLACDPNIQLIFEKCTFFNFTLKLALHSTFSNLLFNQALCFMIVDLATIILSLNIPTPWRPAVKMSMAFWNSPAKDYIPNGLRVYLNKT